MGYYAGPIVLEAPGQSFALRVEINDTQYPEWEAVIDSPASLPPEIANAAAFAVVIADADDDRRGMAARARLDRGFERPILRGIERFAALAETSTPSGKRDRSAELPPR
jgi:hypothetical protein